MLDIESIKANWENAKILAAYNYPIVVESLNDIPALLAELERVTNLGAAASALIERQAAEIKRLSDILDDYQEVEELRAEVERLQGIINTALSLSKPNG